MTPENSFSHVKSPERHQLLTTPVVFMNHLGPEVFTSEEGEVLLERLISENCRAEVIFIEEKENQKRLYARDCFQIFDDLVFSSNHQDAEMAKRYLGKILRREIPVIISRLGEGGKIIRSGDLVLVSDELRNLSDLELLSQRGYQIDFLPIPTKEEEGYLANRMWFSRHIDMEVNIFWAGNHPCLVVNQAYSDRYRRKIEELLEKHKGNLIIIIDELEQTAYRAVNFLELPNEKIVIPENCQETRGKIEELVGKENVLAAKVDLSKTRGGTIISCKYQTGETFWMRSDKVFYCYGGLRCLSNVVI